MGNGYCVHCVRDFAEQAVTKIDQLWGSCLYTSNRFGLLSLKRYREESCLDTANPKPRFFRSVDENIKPACLQHLHTQGTA